MKKFSLFLFAFFVGLFTVNAQSSKVMYKSTVRLLGVEHDGSETLRIVGYGRNRSDAKEQAKKDAVYKVIFEGIKDAGNGAFSRPIVTETNAREKYQEYFDIFFADNGEYQKYVSLKDTKKGSGNRERNKIGYYYEMTIIVLHSQLKARLKSDNVLK